MHRSPVNVSFYCRQLSDAFVSVLLFLHQCADSFYLGHEGNFIILRIDIRREAEQNIFRIEDILKAFYAFQEDIDGQDKDPITVIF